MTEPIQRILQVSTLTEFMHEVNLEDYTPCVAPIVRLMVSEIFLPTKAGSMYKRIALDLQGVSNQDELVWLSQGFRIWWGQNAPVGDRATCIYQGMPTMRALVKAYLTSNGYEVRGGRYGMPDDITPLNGSFSDCVYWKKTGEQTFEVVEQPKDGGQ